MRPKLRIKVPTGYYNKGDIIHPSGAEWDWWVNRGFAEPVRDEGDAIETAVKPDAPERTVKRKRGRPRRAEVR